MIFHVVLFPDGQRSECHPPHPGPASRPRRPCRTGRWGDLCQVSPHGIQIVPTLRDMAMSLWITGQMKHQNPLKKNCFILIEFI